MPIAARFWRWYAMLLSRLAVLLHADCCCCCCCWCCWCCCCCCCCWWVRPELAGLCEQCVAPAPAVCGDWPLPIPDRPPPPTEPSPVPEHGFPSLTSTGTATLRGELCAWNRTGVVNGYPFVPELLGLCRVEGRILALSNFTNAPRNLSHCKFMLHKSHINSPGVKPGSLAWNVGDQLPDSRHHPTDFY